MEMVLQPKRFCLLVLAASVCALLGLCTGAVRADEANEEIANLVIDELKSGDSERQAGAIAIARDIPGASITEALAAELPGLAPPIQVQLLSTLADRGDSTALPAVIGVCDSAHESVRIAAMKAVGQLGDASNVLLLARRASETRGAEQDAARESLYRLRGIEADAAVLGEIGSAAPEVRVELIRAVGRRNISGGMDALLNAATDENRKVRVEALRTLRVVAGPDHVPSLVSVLLNLTSASDRAEAEKTIAAVAHKVVEKDRQASAVLAVLADVKDASDKASLLSVLGRIGDNSALPVLRASLDDPKAEIRDAAIRALADWPTAEPTDDLLEIARTSDKQVHKILALRGFVRLLGQRDDVSAPEVIASYRQAMELAPNDVEKKRVLSGLSGERSLAALEMAAGYLDDPTLRLEAESAAVAIARNLSDSHPQEALGMLERVLRSTASEVIRMRAQEAIDQIKGLGSDGSSQAEVESN